MSKRPYKKNEILEIIWDDAATTQNWHSPNIKNLKDNDGLVRCNTIGYFVRQTKKAIQVTQGYSTSDLKDTQAIPASTIRKIRRLK